MKLKRFGKDLRLMAIYHGLATQTTANLKPSDIRDVPTPLQVKRGHVEKKAFLTHTQVVAQRRLGSLSEYAQEKVERELNMLQLLSDCENVVNL
jgi:hypothetical protein